MANAHSSFTTPNSASLPVQEGGNHPSKFTAKFHRCLGHVEGKVDEPYGVCTASVGYSGAYTEDFRKGARTPKGRARKMREALLREGQKEIAKRFGITEFDFPHPSSTIRHIGFSPSKQKWYGWSHRAVAGFGVDSRVKAGDVIAPHPDYPPEHPEHQFEIGFVAKTLADAKRMASAFALAVS